MIPLNDLLKTYEEIQEARLTRCYPLKTFNWTTKSGRIDASKPNLANTPKKGLPMLHYKNGVLYIEGNSGPEAWFGTLRYNNEITDDMTLDLVESRCDGGFNVKLTYGMAFGFGVSHGKFQFGTFFSVNEDTSVWWGDTGDSPELAIEAGLTLLREDGETPKARVPTIPPRLLDGSVFPRTTCLIGGALCELRRRRKVPFAWTSVDTVDRPMSMWSSAHPHPISVPAKAPHPMKPFYATTTNVKLEHHNTRGGVERANIAIKVLRTIARRARAGTPWHLCGVGEPTSTLAEYKLELDLKDFGCGPCAQISDKLVTNFDLNFHAYIVGYDVAHVCAAIEALPDFKFTQ